MSRQRSMPGREGGGDWKGRWRNGWMDGWIEVERRGERMLQWLHLTAE